MKMRGISRGLLLLAAAAVLSTCGTTPDTGSSADRELLHARVQASIADFKAKDPSMQRFFNNAEGYAVFPHVISGAAGVGGAHGDGEVYQRGKLIGYADVSQGTIGLELGGQKYAEIVFFQNEASLVDFKAATMAFDARATAVAASAGAGATADYQRGVAVFTLPEGGLMAQAAVGGQKFRYMASEER